MRPELEAEVEPPLASKTKVWLRFEWPLHILCHEKAGPDDNAWTRAANCFFDVPFFEHTSGEDLARMIVDVGRLLLADSCGVVGAAISTTESGGRSAR